jgi:amidohydrolase
MTAPIDQAVFDRMVAIRRDLHEHPELSWQEHRTCEKICQELDRLGLSYRRNIGQNGIIADLPGPENVLAVALRADMDALPVHEQTGLPFASKHSGVMHACGHDGHTSMVLGAAQLLLHESRPAPVRLIFQPAEEQGAGAQAMIEAGALDGVGMIFGAHLDRDYPPGQIVVATGAVNASTDKFTIRIRGSGGHGARPHECVDAVVVGSLIVQAIQSIVSREIDPAQPAVVSVGRFRAGTAHNVIAGEALLEGTIRAHHPAVREQLKESLVRMARAVGTLHRADVEAVIEAGTPALINSPEMAAISTQAALETLGQDGLSSLRTVNMGGEDFSFFMKVIPGCYVRIGAQRKGVENFPAHSSKFDFDESALAYGALYFKTVALGAGRKLSEAAT